MLVVGLVYNIVTIHLMSPDPLNWSVWFSPVSRAGSFALGMFLAVISAKGVKLATIPGGSPPPWAWPPCSPS